MKLLPIHGSELINIVATWIAQKENHQWLDFGDGKQTLTPEWLKIITLRDNHILRVFTSDESDTPIGVVALSELNRNFKTARIWAVLGDKSYRARGYATQAVSTMLTLGFRDLGLHAVNTWIVEHNHSIRIVQRLNFTPIGRQRQCHYIDGRPYDRLWFDLLASEHKEI